MLEAYQNDFHSLMGTGKILDTKEVDAFADSYLSYSSAESHERLGVYRNNIMGSLSSVLAETFPLCKLLVGEEYFHKTALEYVAKHLPSEPNLLYWGGSFPDFIHHFGRTHGYEYWGDIAHAEWNLNAVFYAASQDCYAPEDLPNLLAERNDEGTLAICLKGTVKLI